MKLEEIDRNLRVETDITEPDIVWFDIKNAPFSIHGLIYDEKLGCYRRMPTEVAEAASVRAAMLNFHTSGGRVRFHTNSPYIAIRTVMKKDTERVFFNRYSMAGFDIHRAIDGQSRYIATFVPPADVAAEGGYSSFCRTDGLEGDYTIDFPLYTGVRELYIAVKKDAVLTAAAPYDNELPVVFYGSSITQGGFASVPGNLYQGFLSRKLNMDYWNLGLSGACKAEPVLAEYIASLKMKAFVYDYDHNASNPEALENTHMPFYRIIRQAHPDLPVLFLTAPDIHTNYLRPWPKRREIIRRSYEQAKAEGDPVWYIDGATLFDGEDWDCCTIDRIHPNDLGFHRMATRILPVLREMLK